jgi:hypothetical protein
MSNTQYDQISIRKNPAIKLPEGDTISNSSAGTIDAGTSQVKAGSVKLLNNAVITNTESGKVELTGIDIYAGHFIASGDSFPGNTYCVSPDFFASNSQLRIFKTITEALNAITSGGTILVYEGTYNEAITAKSDVSIVGVSSGRVIITSDAACTVSISDVSNFELKNLTIANTNTTGQDPGNPGDPGSACISITAGSSVKLTNLIVMKEVSTSGGLIDIFCDGSAFSTNNSFVYATSNGAESTMLVYLRNTSTAAFESSKFKTANSGSAEYSVYAEDTATIVTMGFSQNQSESNFIYGAGGAIEGLSFNNVSNVADVNFNNSLDTNNNIVDEDFTVS